jgi:hypothetical protein
MDLQTLHNGNFTWRSICNFYHTSHNISYNEGCFPQISTEIIISHFIFSNSVFLKSCRLWNNVEMYFRTGQVTDDNVIRCIFLVCWISKATNSLRIWSACCLGTAKLVARTRAPNVTLYVPCLSCTIIRSNVRFSQLLTTHSVFNGCIRGPLS